MNITNENIELLAQLFDEKLRGIHVKIDAEFTVVNSELKQIKEQVTKTNSRVNHLEDDVKDIREDAYKHVVECPAIAKIDSMDDELIEYRLIKKYPKVGIAIVAFSCIVFLLSTWMLVSKIGINTKAVNVNTVEQIKSDSLNLN